MGQKRVLLKISGETLSGEGGSSLDSHAVTNLIDEIDSLSEETDTRGKKILSCELALVIGGGNFFRGSIQGAELGMGEIDADYAGMVATIVNGIALTSALEKRGYVARHMTAFRVEKVAEPYIYRRAIRHLEKGRVVVLSAGTGNPRASTDSAMVLRGIELGADMVLKGTKVDGIYDKDPKKYHDARFLQSVTYNKFLELNLGILDSTAVAGARADRVEVRVFNIFTPGNFKKIIHGAHVGSVIKD